MYLKGFLIVKSRIALCFLVGTIFLCVVQYEPAGANPAQMEEITDDAEEVVTHEAEFPTKFSANKSLTQTAARKEKYRCTEGHWRMTDDRAVFICD